MLSDRRKRISAKSYNLSVILKTIEKRYANQLSDADIDKIIAELDDQEKSENSTENLTYQGTCSKCGKPVRIWGDLSKELCIECDELQRGEQL